MAPRLEVQGLRVEAMARDLRVVGFVARKSMNTNQSPLENDHVRLA
jgi:hypothetical protein